jgi:short-subunit dehydrogenase involved in D-alanine esterification of teichoic acids
MLVIISTSALEPGDQDGTAGVAPLSACDIKTKAAVKIGIHLTFNGSRRDGPLQVIDLVPPMVRASRYGTHRQVRKRAVHAMLRSDSRCGFCRAIAANSPRRQ